MTSRMFDPVYLIDTCSLMRLDGLNREPPGSTPYTVLERGLIWDGLEWLANDGRLKLIKQIRGSMGIPVLSLAQLTNDEGFFR